MATSPFLSATILNLIINLLYTVIALLIGLCVFSYFDKKLFPDLDFAEEIKKGNLAAAVFVSTVLFFIAYLLAHILK